MSLENSEENLKKGLVFSVYWFHSVKADARWSAVSVHSGMWIKTRRLKQTPSGVRPQIGVGSSNRLHTVSTKWC